MNKDNMSFKEPQQADFTEAPQYKEKVPWKLGRHLKDKHIEQLSALITDYHQYMFHLLNDKGTYVKKD
ncbi:hypothetical protein BACCIP111899_03274 [Bacillus rhizoplanae]|uniref:Uncharacterized protein n=1 Tax=Bacillus rhizoplanae TaxID=2880966 RepID=A0ABN7ZYR9_9BACI|nr:hypothetical protein [Bacillus rhizoplanae]CAG9614047.1 hypothetical protein BACCIP111899_03274 [Bacillus rhizoplanae]